MVASHLEMLEVEFGRKPKLPTDSAQHKAKAENPVVCPDLPLDH
jgi:hypothetical protein